MKKLTIILSLAFLLVFCSPLFSLVKVGEPIVDKFESAHPYDGGAGTVLEKTFHAPHAGYISIHFKKFDLAPGDYVEISSADGLVKHSYRGKGKNTMRGKKISAFWASHIPGDTAVVKLYSKNAKGGYGFAIDKWVRGYEKEIIDILMEDKTESEGEAICSSDDKEGAKCYDGTEMYEKSKAVCRLLINGSGACTGWLVGSEGHIMTNNHCIDTQSDADNTDYEFMAEGTCTTDCGSWFACPGTKEATSGTMVKTSSTLDYTLVLLPTNVTSTYGYMQLRTTVPTVGERIYIPQHPGGKGKMLAVNSDTDGPYCKVYSTNESPCMGGPGDIGYYADTEGGSSGSPVLGYSDNLVVALHHCANCPNRGVPIPSIITDLGSLLPANATSGPGPVTTDIDDGVDSTLTFSTSGDADWTGTTATYYYDNDAAVSGSITHSQTTSFQTSVSFSAEKTVQFYWKVSSEASYDYLTFYVDDVQQDRISGTVDWEQKAYTVSSGSHILKWTFSKDGSVDGGSNQGWVDKLEIEDGGGPVPTYTLNDGVDNNDVTFTTSGTGEWAYDTSDSNDGTDSIKSPVITHSQSASAEASISGATTVKFYWKVSSESGYDYLRFYIDGTLQDSIAGTPAWAQKTYTVSSGAHTLKWTYEKDGSVSSGSDCGWVDQLELTTGGGPATLGDALDNSAVSVTTSGTGDWAIDTAVSYYGGSSIKSPVITHSQDASAEVSVSGVTSVSFYWKASSESGYDYLRFYIDGTLQDSISGTQDWAQKTYTVTSGSHTLKWTYEKDYSVSSGSDCGWVDQLVAN
ncbi:MAG: trypsin-like peptidase domain-containing protein [bacterium]|nr:trypsin-like peptidase domain-containing protein [bacterium]